MMRNAGGTRPSAIRLAATRLGRPLCAGLAALTLGLLAGACDDDRDGAARNQGNQGADAPSEAQRPPRQQAEKPDTPRLPTPDPPKASPGAAPGNARVTGTWAILKSPSGQPPGDKDEGTTYRFEAGGKVTVAGSKQCAYTLEASALKIDCDGALMEGQVEFQDDETIVWTVSGTGPITLKKR